MDREQAEIVETQDCNDSDETAVGEPRMRINRLAPPAGTSYFARQTVTFFNDREIGAGTKYGRFTWRADVYTYATGARPSDPNFSRIGQLFVCMVHSGFVRIYDHFSADIWDQIRCDLTPKTTALMPSLQLPSTESGTQVGDNYEYKINFGQNMPMFRNNGNEAFTFEASYEETFTRVAAKQSSSTAGLIRFLINTTKSSSQHRTTEFYGLSVLTHTNPSAFPVTLTRDFALTGRGMTGWGVYGDVRINLGF